MVSRLLQEVEQRAAATPSLDLYRLYRTTTPAPEIISQLRLQLSSTDLGLLIVDVLFLSFPPFVCLCFAHETLLT